MVSRTRAIVTLYVQSVCLVKLRKKCTVKLYFLLPHESLPWMQTLIIWLPPKYCSHLKQQPAFSKHAFILNSKFLQTKSYWFYTQNIIFSSTYIRPADIITGFLSQKQIAINRATQSAVVEQSLKITWRGWQALVLRLTNRSRQFLHVSGYVQVKKCWFSKQYDVNTQQMKFRDIVQALSCRWCFKLRCSIQIPTLSLTYFHFEATQYFKFCGQQWK